MTEHQQIIDDAFTRIQARSIDWPGRTDGVPLRAVPRSELGVVPVGDDSVPAAAVFHPVEFVWQRGRDSFGAAIWRILGTYKGHRKVVARGSF